MNVHSHFHKSPHPQPKPLKKIHENFAQFKKRKHSLGSTCSQFLPSNHHVHGKSCAFFSSFFFNNYSVTISIFSENPWYLTIIFKKKHQLGLVKSLFVCWSLSNTSRPPPKRRSNAPIGIFRYIHCWCRWSRISTALFSPPRSSGRQFFFRWCGKLHRRRCRRRRCYLWHRRGIIVFVFIFIWDYTSICSKVVYRLALYNDRRTI